MCAVDRRRSQQLHRLPARLHMQFAAGLKVVGGRFHDRADAVALLDSCVNIGQSKGHHRLDAPRLRGRIHVAHAAMPAAGPMAEHHRLRIRPAVRERAAGRERGQPHAEQSPAAAASRSRPLPFNRIVHLPSFRPSSMEAL
jgi:hypothetical protein